MDAGVNLCLHPAPEGFDPWIAAGASLREANADDLLKQYPPQPPVAGVDAILIAVQYRSLKVCYLKVFSQVVSSPARVLKALHGQLAIWARANRPAQGHTASYVKHRHQVSFPLPLAVAQLMRSAAHAQRSSCAAQLMRRNLCAQVCREHLKRRGRLIGAEVPAHQVQLSRGLT